MSSVPGMEETFHIQIQTNLTILEEIGYAKFSEWRRQYRCILRYRPVFPELRSVPTAVETVFNQIQAGIPTVEETVYTQIQVSVSNVEEIVYTMIQGSVPTVEEAVYTIIQDSVHNTGYSLYPDTGQYFHCAGYSLYPDTGQFSHRGGEVYTKIHSSTSTLERTVYTKI